MTVQFGSDPANIEKNLKLLEPIEAIAQAHNCKPAQIALAWLLAQGNDIVPIPGARRIEHLEQNVAAAGIVLTDRERAELGEALSPTLVAGKRYSDASLALTNR